MLFKSDNLRKRDNILMHDEKFGAKGKNKIVIELTELWFYVPLNKK